jgi:hypothetical protein
MRKYVFACALLLLLDASLAHAAGVNLRWDNCYGEGASALPNKTFACDNNAEAFRIVGSFVLAAPASQVSHIDAVVDMVSSGASLPAWWNVSPSGCRTGSMNVDGAWNPANQICEDWTNVGSASSSSIAFTVGALGPNTLRVQLSVASDPQNLLPGPEYFSFNLNLNSIKTVDPGACSGCNIGACIVLSSLKVARADNSVAESLATPSGGANSNYVTWQGGSNSTILGCPAATTPTRSTTWGAVKRMYR